MGRQAAGGVGGAGWPPVLLCPDVRPPSPQDMSSLMQTICEAVDASVHHCSGSSKTLRVKLTVSPEPSSKRKDGPPAVQGEGLGSRAGSSLRRCPVGPALRVVPTPPPHAATPPPPRAHSLCGIGGC